MKKKRENKDKNKNIKGIQIKYKSEETILFELYYYCHKIPSVLCLYLPEQIHPSHSESNFSNVKKKNGNIYY